jgi:hypothetical protein
MQDLKKQLAYIDKTNWFFERDTVDFSTFIPFESDQQYIGGGSYSKGGMMGHH